MGRVKELKMEQEYYVDWLCDIIDQIRESAEYKVNPYLHHSVQVLKNCVTLIEKENLQFEAVAYLDKEKQNIEDIVANISANDTSRDWANAISRKALVLIRKLSDTEKQLNSVNFYKGKVEALEADKQQLTEKLEELTNRHDKEQEETQSQIETLRSDIENKDKLLQDAKTQYERAKSQVEAQENINDRITNSFKHLSQLSDIIRFEKKRLNVLYYVYMIISGIILLCFFAIEGYMWYNLLQKENVNWLEYLRFYLPVPLCSGLLWFSVYQMNRAHRMLLNIVNQLHNIDYVEGLLLAVNNLSLDAGEGLHKVQDILDQLVKKYLSHLDFLSESALDNAISKDKVKIDTDKLVSLLGGIRNVMEKDK